MIKECKTETKRTVIEKQLKQEQWKQKTGDTFKAITSCFRVREKKGKCIDKHSI